MKRIAYLLVICLGLGVGIVAGARRLSRPASVPAPVRAAHATEQEWLVSDITNAILNIAAFAKHESDDGESPRVVDLHVTAPGVLAKFSIERRAQHYTIDVTDHLWAPGAFVGMARELIGPATVTAAPDGRLLVAALTDPTAEVIQSENTRLSRLLAKEPRSSALHEQAALLLGALALRENASILSDPRVMMARMTAHLAIARALVPGASTLEGRLAEAVLLTLVNRQRDAMARLDAIDQSDPSPMVRAWTRALRVRTTKDWRLVSNVASASLLEQRETLRAAHQTVGDARSLPMVDLLAQEDVIDWGRIILHESPTVEGGNRFSDTAVAFELRDAFAVRQSFAPSLGRDDHRLIRALDAEPQAGPAGANDEFWIIDWGLWAASSQRHLAASLACTSRHYRKMLGLDDEAAAMDRKAREDFGALRLFPLVALEAAIDTESVADYTAAVSAAGTLARAHPDVVTDFLWAHFQEKKDFAPPPAAIPPAAPWFSPLFPAGTAFEPPRIYTAGSHLDPAQIEALKAIAPFERAFVFRSIELRFGPKPGVDVLRREIGSLADYDDRAAWQIASAAIDTPDVYLPIVRRLAETMDPENWYWVAEYLVEHGREDEALVPFERYRQEARDLVGISNRADWFVKRLIREGQRPRALAMAKDAADVNSYVGLTTYADALDITGETRRAEQIYRDAAERYFPSGDGALLAFLERHRTDSAAYAAEAREVSAKVFPKGLEAATAQSLSGPPDAGLSVSTTGAIGEQNGVQKGDVIVAVDGSRVRSLTQYRAIKFQSWEPEMRFIVWRDGKYIEVPTRLRHRWIKNVLRPYHPG
jgi:hypothetical protein